MIVAAHSCARPPSERSPACRRPSGISSTSSRPPSAPTTSVLQAMKRIKRMRSRISAVRGDPHAGRYRVRGGCYRVAARVLPPVTGCRGVRGAPVSKSFRCPQEGSLGKNAYDLVDFVALSPPGGTENSSKLFPRPPGAGPHFAAAFDSRHGRSRRYRNSTRMNLVLFLIV